VGKCVKLCIMATSLRLNNVDAEFEKAIRMKKIELLAQDKDFKKEDIVKEIVLEWKKDRDTKASS